jgi:hypothetical protein
MMRAFAAGTLAAAIAASAPLRAQDVSPAATDDAAYQRRAVESIDHVRAALENPPSKLTLQERTPDFSVHIEKRRPMQDIFDTPPWQLPPHGWQPPAWSTGINLMSLVSYVAKGIADAKYAHDQRVAREEVQRTIADYCAAQESHGASIAICR